MYDQHFCKRFIKKVPSELELISVLHGFIYLQKIVDGLRPAFLLSRRKISLEERSEYNVAIKFLKGLTWGVKSLHLYF